MNRRRLLILALILTALIALPDDAQAGRRRRFRRGGPVYSAYGMLYNTNSREWRMAGGNLTLYYQIVQREALLRQQRAMLKQQQILRKRYRRQQQRARQRTRTH